MKTKIRELFVNQKASSLKKGTAFNLTLAFMALMLMSLTVTVAPAQSIPNRGSKVGNSYAVGDFETVNTTNGNLMLNFPLGSLPQGRGEVGAGINLIYNSKLYDTQIDKILDPRYSCSPEFLGPDNCRYFDRTVMLQSNKGGWKYGGFYSLEFEDRRSSFGQNPPACVNQGVMTGDWQQMTYVHKLRVVFPDGSAHEMIPEFQQDALGDRFYRVRMDGTVEQCGYGTTQGARPVYYSIDGTYVRLESTTDNNWTLYFSDGRKVVNTNGQAQRIFDRNGNYVDTTGTQITDQFGRSVTVVPTSSGDEVRVKGVGGAEDLVWTVKWKIIGVYKTYQACATGGTSCPANEERGRLAEGISVVDKITMPQQLGGQAYTFSYNAPLNAPPYPQTTYGWGEVSGVQLPTGAQISYSYAMDGLDGGTDSWSVKEILRNYPNSKTLAYNRDYDGALTPTTEGWGYSTSASSGQISSSDGSETLNYFGDTDQENWSSGLTYKSVSTNGTMTENLWAFNCPFTCPSPGPVSGINPYIKTEFTSIKDSLGNYSLTTIKDYSYDKNGNVTQVKEYDWMPYADVRDQYGQITGIPTGAVPKRITASSFVAPVPDAGTSTTNGNLYVWANSPTNLKHLPLWTEVRDGSGTGTPVSRAEMLYDNLTTGNVTAGNLTTSTAWDTTKGASSNPLTTNNSISTTADYNSYGMPTLTTDARGYQTQISYGSVIGPNGAVTDLYPTQVVSAYGTSIQQTVQTEYDFYTGLPKKVTTLGNTTNENVSSEIVYDAAGRPLISKAATGTASEVWTQTSYDDAARRITTKSDLFVKGDGRKVAVQFYDQLGRVRLSKSLEDSQTQSATNETDGIKVQTRYLTGNPYSYQLVSNPYRATTATGATNEPSMGWTLSKTINTGKFSEVQSFFGAALPAAFGGSNANSSGSVRTDIDADRILVTDQAGKRRISKTNALGQLINVWEVKEADADTEAITFGNPALSLNGLKTSYEYDTLNNLTKVIQGTQTNRNFSYSSLSRLLTAQNPESGTIDYLYDNNGNLTKKTDARLVETNYLYDALNRVTNRSYAAPAGLANYQASLPVTYTYDNLPNAKGRLTKVVTGTGATPFSVTEYTSFDIMGRVTGHKQTTDGTAYTTAYVYNLSGAMVEETYPSTRKVKNVLDNDGDLSTVKSRKNANDSRYWNYADNFVYTAAGAVGSMKLGNNLTESTAYNSRLQPEQIALDNTAASSNLWKVNYQYGDLNWDGSVLPGTNNGNLAKQTIHVPGIGGNPAFTAVQNYDYDALNRIQIASETLTPNGQSGQQTWTQTYKYDRYGNREFDTTNNGTTTIPTGCAQAVCNPTPNTVNNRLNDYSYDNAGNTTVDAAGKVFSYDGENKQTKVVSGGVTIGEYFYDGDGKRVKKIALDENNQLQTTIFVYDASGKMVAEYSTVVATQANAKVSYLTADHLGSPRINTDKYGDVISRHDYHPFGEEIGRASYGADNVRQKFTSYERDIESDLDFAQARYYSSKLGRFYSVDPENAGASADNSQTWNAYAYVGNNPLNITDPTGLTWYFNKEINEYRWYGDKDKVGSGFVTVVGNTGEAGSFSYETEGGTFVTLDPYSNNYQANIATKADAMKLADRLYQFDERKRAFAAGFNKNYDTNLSIVTALAVGDIAIIAAPVIGLSGAGTATLGLTGTAAAAAPTGAALLNQLMNKADFVKDLTSKTQFAIRGNAQQIFDGIAQGATKIGPNAVRMADGKIVSIYESSKAGPLQGPTIQVVENGIKYVYRIQP